MPCWFGPLTRGVDGLGCVVCCSCVLVGCRMRYVAHPNCLRGLEDRLRHGLAFDPPVETENLNFQTAELRDTAYPSGISLRGSELTCRSPHSKNFGE